MNKRPLSVAIIGCLYMAMGVIGFVYHFTEFTAAGKFQYDVLWIELLRLTAFACGAFILRGHNWARWLALGWIGLHVIVSAFHTLPELAIHSLFFAVIAWVLFRPEAGEYFGARRTDQVKM